MKYNPYRVKYIFDPDQVLVNSFGQAAIHPELHQVIQTH
jgi:hypothetical protein